MSTVFRWWRRALFEKMIWWTRTAPPHSSVLYTACAFTHHPCQFGHVCLSRGTWQIDSPADVQREGPERNHGRICFDTPTYLGRHSSECFSSPITRCNSLRFSRDLVRCAEHTCGSCTAYIRGLSQQGSTAKDMRQPPPASAVPPPLKHARRSVKPRSLGTMYVLSPLVV